MLRRHVDSELCLNNQMIVNIRLARTLGQLYLPNTDEPREILTPALMQI